MVPQKLLRLNVSFLHEKTCIRTAHVIIVCKDSEYMVAVRNYITENRAHLSFHKGDIIRLQHMKGLEAGETMTLNHETNKLLTFIFCVFLCVF